MKIIAIAFGLIFTIVCISFVPLVFDSSRDVITTAYTDTGNVTTGANETEGNVTLTEDPYMNWITSVTTITSTFGNDTPLASTYNEVTNDLEVSGLIASQTRTLTMTYDYDSADEFPNAAQVVSIVPTIVLISLIALVVAIPASLLFIGWRRMTSR